MGLQLLNPVLLRYFIDAAMGGATDRRLFISTITKNSSTEAIAWIPTCLVVSHRPAILQQADHIIVLEEGRVQAEGKWIDLQEFLSFLYV